MTIPVSLALSLREAGLRWTPRLGDRFVLPYRDMDGDVFVLSDMTVDVHDFPTGRVIGFNGVTEWALDSVQAEEALWLPAEDQLRDLLGGLFVRLGASPSDGEARRFTVTLLRDGAEVDVSGDSAAEAYGTALLQVLRDLQDADA